MGSEAVSLEVGPDGLEPHNPIETFLGIPQTRKVEAKLPKLLSNIWIRMTTLEKPFPGLFFRGMRHYRHLVGIFRKTKPNTKRSNVIQGELTH